MSFSKSFLACSNCPVSYLESISQGTPVLGFSMPIQLLINNGVGFKTRTPADCVAKIRELENNYNSSVKKAINTAQLFSWKKTASETIKVYKDILGFHGQD